jgi:hypothetical protein
MGNQFIGIVHPCKIYNILRIGGPVLYIGPVESHITDIADRFKTQRICVARHGNSDSIAEQIIGLSNQKAAVSRSPLTAFSKEQLLPQLISFIEAPTLLAEENFNAVVSAYPPDPDPNAQEVVSL